jgi:hypothetical protein
MRIAPNHPRLRAIAVACWALGGWWIVQIGLLTSGRLATALIIFMALLGIVLLALGIAFWALGSDRRAGVVFDNKGVLLNLGHSASFVSWENIERIGTSNQRLSWLSLGSAQMLGIRLRDLQPYLQSYEARLPAAGGLFGLTLRWLRDLLDRLAANDAVPSVEQLARVRARTGYDILVPEALLGGQAGAFVELIESYRRERR